jgi:hypothetical protein
MLAATAAGVSTSNSQCVRPDMCGDSIAGVDGVKLVKGVKRTLHEEHEGPEDHEEKIDYLIRKDLSWTIP